MPGSGLPSAPTSTLEASNPESCTIRLVVLREKPNRNSLSSVGENVWVSVRTPERLIGVLLVPPSAGRAPAVTAVPSYSAQRPVRWSFWPKLWSILIRPVLSNVEALTLAMKLLEEPAAAALGMGQ